MAQPSTGARRRALLTAALGVALLDSTAPEVLLVNWWLGTWTGIGLVTAGVARQDYDLELVRYADRGWRATFYPSGFLGTAHRSR